MKRNRLLWLAVTPQTLSTEGVSAIVQETSRNALRDGLDGTILFDRPQLVGCVEGGLPLLNRFFKRLMSETLANGLNILSLGETSDSLFQGWSAVAPELQGLPMDANRTHYQRHGYDAPLHPLRLGLPKLVQLLRDLHEQRGVIRLDRLDLLGQAGVETVSDPIPQYGSRLRLRNSVV